MTYIHLDLSLMHPNRVMHGAMAGESSAISLSFQNRTLITGISFVAFRFWSGDPLLFKTSISKWSKLRSPRVSPDIRPEPMTRNTQTHMYIMFSFKEFSSQECSVSLRLAAGKSISSFRPNPHPKHSQSIDIGGLSSLKSQI